MQRAIPESGILFLPYLGRESAAKQTREFLRSGLVLDGENKHSILSDGTLWKADETRAAGRKAHAWFFARPWYSAAGLLEDDEKNRLLSKLGQALETWSDLSKDVNSMAFHDETTAQRAMVFVALLFAYEDVLSVDLKEKLSESLRSDIELLAEDSFYAGSNNHGMFQDIALLVAVGYGFVGDSATAYEDKAFSRLFQYFISSFTSDGIHTENNPTYHVMVARYMTRVIEYAHVRGRSEQFSALKELITAADLYAAFAVTPLGDFPPISDTNLNTLSAQSARATFKENHLVGAITRGEGGTLPKTNVFVAETSGYGIARSGWTSKDDDYLFFNAAYNADYHKHSDELSIYYVTGGYEILTEAGPNGYQYDDPFTKYAFSSFAHNTLIVDGEGLRRTDGNAHLTKLVDQGSTKTKLQVMGQTQRFTGVQWSRSVEYDTSSPGGNDLRVIDNIFADEDHVFKFIWHVGKKLVPFVRGSFIEFYALDTQEKIAEMEWTGTPATTIRVFKGQRHPRVQGWQFPAMGKGIPTYSVEVEFETSKVAVNWVLRTSNFILTDRGITPFNSEWKTFHGEKPVHYLLDIPDGKNEVKDLTVVFSAVHQIGDFTFNYRASLTEHQGAVLYVLDDFGDQGSYYLSNGRRFAEFRSVQGLLKSVASELGVPMDQVKTLGSSKGGTSALLHGAALGVADVYAGAPQYLIGDFLKDPHPNILSYMAGGNTEADIYWANKIAFDILSSGVKSTRIHILVGLKDSHYRRHTIPLVDDARSLGYETEFLTVPGSPHSEFGKTFREFLRSLVAQNDEPSSYLLPHAVGFETSTGMFGVSVSLPPGATAFGQLIAGSEKVGSLQKFRSNNASWKIEKSGAYRVRVYIDIPGEADRKAFGTSVRTLRL